jgi:hypothetical protein
MKKKRPFHMLGNRDNESVQAEYDNDVDSQYLGEMENDGGFEQHQHKQEFKEPANKR